MERFDFEKFIKHGSILGFSENSEESAIIEILGNPSEIESYTNGGKYLHYENVRFSFFQNYLNGITLSFYKNSINIVQCSSGNEIFSVNENTSLIEMIALLNKFKIRWEISYEKSKLDYLQITTSSSIEIYYYYYDSKLVKINKTFWQEQSK